MDILLVTPFYWEMLDITEVEDFLFLFPDFVAYRRCIFEVKIKIVVHFVSPLQLVNGTTSLYQEITYLSTIFVSVNVTHRGTFRSALVPVV